MSGTNANITVTTPVADLAIKQDGKNIAAGTFVATHDPDGNGVSVTLAGVNKLQSYTVTVSEAGVTPNSANIVTISFGGGNPLRLVKGDVNTFSIGQQANANEFINNPPVVTCLGNSAAKVTWTETV